MTKKLLVFGSGGFVGRYLAEEFKSNGYDVIGSDRKGYSPAILDNYYQCDITDPSGIKRVLNETKPDYIINLAAVSSVKKSWECPSLTAEVNIVGTINLLDSIKSIVPSAKVLLIGSSEEYAPSDSALAETSLLNATNPYGISKIAQESYAKLYSEQFGLSIYRTRSFNHTGVGQPDSFVLSSWCSQVAAIQASGKPGTMNVGNLAISRDFTDVRDVVRGYRLLIESRYHSDVFNFGNSCSKKLSDYLDIIRSLSDMNIRVNVDEVIMRPSDNPIICSDCSKAKKLLGWKPAISIEDTLKEMFIDGLQHHLRRNA